VILINFAPIISFAKVMTFPAQSISAALGLKNDFLGNTSTRNLLTTKTMVENPESSIATLLLDVLLIYT
jgi:hypothetical protein